MGTLKAITAFIRFAFGLLPTLGSLWWGKRKARKAFVEALRATGLSASISEQLADMYPQIEFRDSGQFLYKKRC